MNTQSSNVLLDDSLENGLSLANLSDGQNISLTKLDDNNNFVYSWNFKGENIDNPRIPLITEVTFTNEEVSKLVAKFKDVTYLNFTHDGKLPGKASISYHVGDKYAAGTKLYIQHYNESTKKLENIGQAVVDNDGNITFDITECSSYVLYTGVETVVENANTGDINLAIILSIIIIAAMGLAVTFKKLVTR